MENIWLSIQTFRNQTIIDNSDIETYFTKLYEDKRTSLYETFKDDIANKMLENYVAKLSGLQKLYSMRFDHFFNNFKRDLEEDKNKSVIKVILYGPDHHYTNEEEFILNKALTNFCFELSKKNYPYNVKEEQKTVNDFMDGTCTIGYKILEITLK
jgi:hypothetical protein